jgi:hypothetical protein
MSQSREAQYLKDEGSACWSRGAYEEAKEKFTEALQLILDHSSSDITPTERKELLKILYSNRSAAYLKLNKKNESYEDATKCVSMDTTWSKGFIRQGDALYALGKYTECLAAYESALLLTPRDQSVQEKCEVARRAVRNDSRQPSWGTNNGPPAILPGVISNNASPLLVTIQMACKVVALVGMFICFIPFIGRHISTLSHKIALASAALSFIIAMFSTHGTPQFNSVYLERIVTDASATSLFLAIMQFTSKPYFLAMLPIFLTESVLVTQFTAKLLQHRSPTTVKTLEAFIDKNIIPKVLPHDEITNWTRFSTPQRWTYIISKVMFNRCWFEVGQMLYLLFELFLPSRSLIFLYLWSQYLRMRYMMDTTGAMIKIFTFIDNRITVFLAHNK